MLIFSIIKWSTNETMAPQALCWHTSKWNQFLVYSNTSNYLLHRFYQLGGKRQLILLEKLIWLSWTLLSLANGLILFLKTMFLKSFRRFCGGSMKCEGITLSLNMLNIFHLLLEPWLILIQRLNIGRAGLVTVWSMCIIINALWIFFGILLIAGFYI